MVSLDCSRFPGTANRCAAASRCWCRTRGFGPIWAARPGPQYEAHFTSVRMAHDVIEGIDEIARAPRMLTSRWAPPKARVSYVHSICVANDAISEAIRNEIEWLTESDAFDVKLFCNACDSKSVPFRRIDSMAELVFDPHFQDCDLVVFHFGIYYPLFNAFPVAPARARRLVVFHNVTPREFIAPEHKSTMDRSLEQMANIAFADHVICDSQYNLDVLRAAGIATSATVVPLAVGRGFRAPPVKPSFHDGVLRIAFIGRFVRSKGPHELLEAVGQVLRGEPQQRMAVDLVGNLSFSDAGLLDELRQTIQTLRQTSGGKVQVSLHGSAPAKEKLQVLRDADLFVLPTYHEGFGVPVVEALASGCRAIAYENSNVPSIAGGLARLCPTGDVPALSEAISQVSAEIATNAWKNLGGYESYVEQSSSYVRQFSPDQVRPRYLDVIRGLTIH